MVIRYESISFWQQDDAPWDRACEALAQLTPGLGPSPANPRTPSPVARIRPFKGIQGKVCTKNMDGTSFKSALEQSFATCFFSHWNVFHLFQHCFWSILTNNNSFVSHKYTLVPFKNTPLMCALSVSPSFIGLTCSVFRSLQDFVFTSVVHVSHVNAMSMPCQCHVNAMSI